MLLADMLSYSDIGAEETKRLQGDRKKLQYRDIRVSVQCRLNCVPSASVAPPLGPNWVAIHAWGWGGGRGVE
jgi:hypothetical protein